MYVIIKKIKTKNKTKIPVILLDSQGEIWEFDTEIEAEKMKDAFQTNSDSGYIYEVKKI